jgi:vancomycin permeability regulator SanA
VTIFHRFAGRLGRVMLVPPRRWLRRVTTAGVLGLALAVLALAGSGLWIKGESHGHTYAEESVPDAPVALVLGAQVYPDGTPSAYLTARLDLAKRLLDAGKVKAILVSDIWRRNVVRERFAAVKAGYDAVSGRDPVFLGRHETGVDEAVRAS